MWYRCILRTWHHCIFIWPCADRMSGHLVHIWNRSSTERDWHSCALSNVKLHLGFMWMLCLKIVANRQWISLVREVLTNVALRAPNIFEHLKWAVIWRGVWFSFNISVSSSFSLVWGLIHETALNFNAGGGMKWRWVSNPMTRKKKVLYINYITHHGHQDSVTDHSRTTCKTAIRKKKNACGSICLLECESD